MTWARGVADVEKLLRDRELETVTPDDALAERLIDEAVRHVAAASVITELDAAGAYQLYYDAVRKVCGALLSVQGLRSTTRGGHIAVQDVARAQFGAPFTGFNRMRRTRNQTEYPGPTSPRVTAADLEDAARTAEKILERAKVVIQSGELTRFR